ncbi:MAG: ribosome silencing factor [Rubrivivax sp.]|nr:ribosome silencing factor [Rubrivivax sp.]
MDIRKLQRAIVDGLEDVKAQNVVVFNTEALSPLFERVIIASGTSNRQTKALASSVRETVKKRGLQVLRTEGEDNGEWIIVDCGAAVAHIMQPAIRDYYHLEEIWGAKPVKMKGVADGRPPGAATPAAEPAPAGDGKAARKAASAGSPGRPVGATKAGAKSGPTPGAKSGAGSGAKSDARSRAKSGAKAAARKTAAKAPPRAAPKAPARKAPARGAAKGTSASKQPRARKFPAKPAATPVARAGRPAAKVPRKAPTRPR